MESILLILVLLIGCSLIVPFILLILFVLIGKRRSASAKLLRLVNLIGPGTSCSPVSHGWHSASAADGLYVGSLLIIDLINSIASGEISAQRSPRNSTSHS